MTADGYRALVRGMVDRIAPLDAREADDRAAALAWVDGGAPLCRTAKPATPPTHLVSYAVAVSPRAESPGPRAVSPGPGADAGHARPGDGPEAVLLVDHRLSGLWLPTGGHVDPGEHPTVTAARELHEELGVAPVPLAGVPAPLFVSVTTTVGATAGHVDVSLWYAFALSPAAPLTPDPREFAGTRWWPAGDVAHGPAPASAPRCPASSPSWGPPDDGRGRRPQRGAARRQVVDRGGAAGGVRPALAEPRRRRVGAGHAPAPAPGPRPAPGGARPEVEALVPALVAGLYASVVAHSRLGLDVVVDIGHHDGYATPRGTLAIAADHLAGLPAWLVGVHCPLDVVMDRRDASPPGSYAVRGPDGAVPPAAELWQRLVHEPGTYDLEVDTSACTPAEAAAAVLDLVAAGRPRAFAELLARTTG